MIGTDSSYAPSATRLEVGIVCVRAYIYIIGDLHLILIVCFCTVTHYILSRQVCNKQQFTILGSTSVMLLYGSCEPISSFTATVGYTSLIWNT